MNDRKTLQKKRRAAGNGGLKILHSKARRRKTQRVAAGAAASPDLGSEVPNLGVARALFVILLLHVAAIAAIFVHNRLTNDDPVVHKSPVLPEGGVAATVAPANLPQVARGEDYYFAATGDTYEKIARARNVDVTALRELNNDVEVHPGRILRLPTGAPVPSAARVVAAAPPVARAEEVVHGAPRAMIVPEDPPAVRVRPQVASPVTTVAPSSSETVYTVRTGDTAWGISNRFKVTPDALLQLNGVTDARKLRVGMTLKIPAGN